MKSKIVAVLLVTAVVAGCSSEEGTGAARPQNILTAATLGEQSVLSNRDYLLQERYATADLENGKTRAQLCKACHSLDAGGVHMIGPNLHGVFGKTAGKAEGFAYSQVLADAEFVWTPRALDAWLSAPGRFLPGNLMTFPGVQDAADRDDLIAYLLRFADAGVEQ